MKKFKENLIVGLATAVILTVFIVGPIAAHIWAPCKYMDWMPTKNVPARCLKAEVGR